jgi:hypothetical protein
MRWNEEKEVGRRCVVDGVVVVGVVVLAIGGDCGALFRTRRECAIPMWSVVGKRVF